MHLESNLELRQHTTSSDNDVHKIVSTVKDYLDTKTTFINIMSTVQVKVDITNSVAEEPKTSSAVKTNPDTETSVIDLAWLVIVASAITLGMALIVKDYQNTTIMNID